MIMVRQRFKKQENKKKMKRKVISKEVRYPDPSLEECKIKTFYIKYEKNLSPIAKLILNSFRAKYVYYAIDDIIYLLRSKPIERDNLLAILYVPIISLQNNLCINFFDIWIYEIYINEISKFNKFVSQNSKNLKQLNYITIKFAYKTSSPIKKPDLPW